MPGFNQYDDAEGEVWKEEFTLDYAQRTALIPKRCTPGAIQQGTSTVHFTVVQDNQQTTGRNRDGDIIYRNTDQDGQTAELEEALAAEEIDNFTLFKSSVDQRKIMWKRVAGAIERDKDDKLLTELNTTTNVYNSGTPVQLTAAHVKRILFEHRVRTAGAEGVSTGLLSEGAFIALQSLAQVASKDYVEEYKLRGRRAFEWEGVLWMPHPRLPGFGVASTDVTCFLFHQAAVGFHEAGEADILVDFDKKHRKWFCNGQEWCVAHMLLEDGVTEFHHNDATAFT